MYATGLHMVLSSVLTRSLEVLVYQPPERHQHGSLSGDQRPAVAAAAVILYVMKVSPSRASAERVDPATPSETIVALLERSGREEVPIRKTFLQQGAGRVRTPGPIAALVRSHDERALDFYLLAHAVCSAGDFDVTLAAGVWGRAILLSNSSSSRSTVSKAFRRLEDLKLLSRSRDGSRSKVTLLDESGNGESYRHPASGTQRYLRLPHAYWGDEWHLKLGLRAKAMMLIALSLDDGFVLPIEKAPDWYGISADTANRGLLDLRNVGLLDVEKRTKKAPLSPEGIAQDFHYTLNPPFGPRRQPIAIVTNIATGAKRRTG